MNINVSFRHMDASPALRDYATSKLERICDKYVSGKVSADITMTVEKHRHIANFTLSIRSLTVRGVEKTEDMYSSVDLALAKIEKQLRRHKDRIRDHQPSSEESRMFRMGVLAPVSEEPSVAVDEEEEFAADYEPAVEQAAGLAEPSAVKETVTTKEGKVALLRQGSYQAKALSIDEAALQLDLLVDRSFYVFMEQETGHICVMYRRDDGNLGLIDTGN